MDLYCAFNSYCSGGDVKNKFLREKQFLFLFLFFLVNMVQKVLGKCLDLDHS